MEKVRFAIIGAGFAGASTAYHLCKGGARGVLLIEREPSPGVHASGLNAAIIAQWDGDEAVASLLRDGASFQNSPPRDWPLELGYRRTGSLLLAKGEELSLLEENLKGLRKRNTPGEIIGPEEAAKKVPLLKGADFERALFCPSDGVADIHAFLQGYLKGIRDAGGRLLNECELKGIERGRRGGFRLETSLGEVSAGVLVNAAGAWAGEVARMAGAFALPLRPCRRHIFITPPLPWASPLWPVVWDSTHNIYFRPESGGILMSPCDEEEHPARPPAVDPRGEVLLAEKAESFLPGLLEVPLLRGWACLRTLTPDGRFIIGWDPRLSDFFWVAGLGGHGMGTSYPVGALASGLLLGKGNPGAEPFSPERFNP